MIERRLTAAFIAAFISLAASAAVMALTPIGAFLFGLSRDAEALGYYMAASGICGILALLAGMAAVLLIITAVDDDDDDQDDDSC